VEAGDSRQGLDDAGKKEVMRIMKRMGVDFDEARRMFMQDRFKQNNIGADGIPRDPKFVSFS
jgi:antitoxin component of RelBE/YafQ-DinJ toxin-antitoxin module